MHKKLIDNIKTELFISVRMNFILIAFPLIQIWTMQYWSDDITVKQAFISAILNLVICFIFSLPVGVFRQYLKK
jgi:hypothetical protein